MKYFDRVKELSTSTSTGDFTLAGASTGYRTFASVLTIGDTCYYCISGGAEWEVGYGTYSAANTLARTTVHASSNSGALVNFSAGTKDVFLTVVADFFAGILPRIIAAVTVSSSNTNIVTLSGLSITNGQIYKLYSQIKNTLTSGNDLRCWANSDSDSNYKLAHIERTQSSLTNGSGAYSSLGFVTEGVSSGCSYVTFESTLSMNSGIFQVMSRKVAIRSDNSVYNYDFRAFSRTGTLSSIAQLVLTTNTSNCLGVGSSFTLIRIV